MLTIINYTSFGEFLEDAAKVRGNPTAQLERMDGPKWVGDVTYQEALSLARHGWPEGTAKIKEISDVIVNKLTSLIEVPEVHYDVTGIDYDMGMYLSGAPETWYRFESRIQEGTGNSILRMVYNYGARGDIEPETMRARGYVAASLIQLLEYAGKRVELIAVNKVSLHGEHDDVYLRIPVKVADQSLDIDRLSFILVHPAMLRKLGFGVRSSRGGFDYSAGGSVDVPEQDRGDIYFNASVGANWRNTERAKEYVLEQLKTQGVQFNSEEKAYA